MKTTSTIAGHIKVARVTPSAPQHCRNWTFGGSGKVRAGFGSAGAIQECMTAHRDYLAKQSTETLAALRQKYEAVPTHLRMFCGDMDEKDMPIRMILYGKDQIENWSHHQVAKQAGEELPSIDIPEPPGDTPARGRNETDSS